MKHEPIEVTPHLFQLGTRSFPVYLSMGEMGMIIEGGTGPTFNIISSQIDSLGIDPMKIRYIALTHTHADHVGAVPHLKKDFPHIKVLASSTAEKFLKKERFIKEFLPTDTMIGKILKDTGDIEDMPPVLEEYDFGANSVLSEGDEIDLGDGVIWEVFNTPGHSPCHISLFEKKEKSLALGDVTGYFDPERDVFWPNYFFSLEKYTASISKMAEVSANRILLSHNGVILNNGGSHLLKALKATEGYHNEMLERLGNGDSREDICRDKADWICSIGALATYNVLTFLCNLMIDNSLKDREKKLFPLS